MDNNLFANYDYEQEYACSRRIKCNHFTKLMYLIINSDVVGYDNIITYILKNKEEINEHNALGWTCGHTNFVCMIRRNPP
jgi:hypothetical protein